MTEFILNQVEFFVKLLAAGLCGALIGFERKNHLKEAGIRTHMLVAIGSALIMLVSEYGFDDFLNKHGYDLDPSRIAAQIVTGIGFLGAGMIFIKKQTVNGLTTAAGIWTTAGIGMAIGTGMYIAGFITTGLVFIVQVFLQRDYKWLKVPSVRRVFIQSDDSMESLSFVQLKFTENSIEIVDLKAEKRENGLIDIELYIKLPPRFEPARLLDMFIDNSHIRKIEF